MAEIMTSRQRAASADRHDKFSYSAHCPHLDQPCSFGAALCARLQQAMTLAVPLLGKDADLRGTVAITGCKRPCAWAFRATAQDIWCLGDVMPGQMVDLPRDLDRDDWAGGSARIMIHVPSGPVVLQ